MNCLKFWVYCICKSEHFKFSKSIKYCAATYMLFPSEVKIFMKFTFYFYKHLNFNLDGDWTSWSTFTSCSTSCGEGLQTRFRSCSEPPPLYGGSDCTGEDIESQACNTLIVCPIGKHIDEIQFLVTTRKTQFYMFYIV